MQRMNDWLARRITRAVGTMPCAFFFCLIALTGLPSALQAGGVFLISWVSGSFLQLVLLPVIMVGQGLQASDAHEHLQDLHQSHIQLHTHHGIGDHRTAQ